MGLSPASPAACPLPHQTGPYAAHEQAEPRQALAALWGAAGSRDALSLPVAGGCPCRVPACWLLSPVCRSRFGVTPAPQRVSLLQSPLCVPEGWQDPPGLPPSPWPQFPPSWGDFAAVLLAAETSEQEESLAPAAGLLLQPLSCRSSPAPLDHPCAVRSVSQQHHSPCLHTHTHTCDWKVPDTWHCHLVTSQCRGVCRRQGEPWERLEQ